MITIRITEREAKLIKEGLYLLDRRMAELHKDGSVTQSELEEVCDKSAELSAYISLMEIQADEDGLLKD